MVRVYADDHGRLAWYRDGPQGATQFAVHLQQDLLRDRAQLLLVRYGARLDHLLAKVAIHWRKKGSLMLRCNNWTLIVQRRILSSLVI